MHSVERAANEICPGLKLLQAVRFQSAPEISSLHSKDAIDRLAYSLHTLHSKPRHSPQRRDASSLSAGEMPSCKQA